MNSTFTKLALTACFILATNQGNVSADIISTSFAANNGQSGNMFDINILSPTGIEISQFDLNLDPGSWNIELYTRTGTHVGSESTPADWTLRQTSIGVNSVAPNSPTTWDISDFTLDAGLSAIYINVTNGSPLNYINGTGVGNLAAANSNIEIFEGTGNAANFGSQFRPRVFSGSIVFEPVALQLTPVSAAVPEPGSLIAITVFCLAMTSVRRQRG